MTAATRTQLARDLYLAFADGNRELVESMLAQGFTFSSPVEPTGAKGRNTEILTFIDDRIIGAEVYFGWNLQ